MPFYAYILGPFCIKESKESMIQTLCELPGKLINIIRSNIMDHFCL